MRQNFRNKRGESLHIVFNEYMHLICMRHIQGDIIHSRSLTWGNVPSLIQAFIAA